MSPRVSVVIPVHNCMPYLTTTLASIRHQTFAAEQVEVIAVDDGSTDGSSALLAAWQEDWPQLRVHTQPASGAAGPPRNVGIDLARGEFVFFLDGDDCLGPEALERLVAYADLNGSDVVLAGIVGVRRNVGAPVLQQDIPRADLTSGIYYTLMPFKLVRRQLLVEHEIRFPENVRVSEDQLFTAHCYLEADVISVLGSYAGYYLIRREDGSNVSAEGLDYGRMLSQADDVVRLIRELTEPGAVQCHLIARHVRIEMMNRLARRFLGESAVERRNMIDVATPYAQAWDVPGLREQLPVHQRLMLAAVQSGDVQRLAEVIQWHAHGSRSPMVRHGDRWWQCGPGFDEASDRSSYDVATPPQAIAQTDTVAWDGSTLQLRGFALLKGVPAARTATKVLLQHADTGETISHPVRTHVMPHATSLHGGTELDYDSSGFACSIDLAGRQWAAGRWRVFAEVSYPDHTGRAPVVPPRGFIPEDRTWTSPSGPRRVTVNQMSKGLVVDVHPRPLARSLRRLASVVRSVRT